MMRTFMFWVGDSRRGKIDHCCEGSAQHGRLRRACDSPHEQPNCTSPPPTMTGVPACRSLFSRFL
ncbi:hypothetical protein KCP73_11155 [Salmonella enterica subsp. enterica]|nr:hypothetical protein KCP73_11155 [Salmonella enterica subsp. enterica]